MASIIVVVMSIQAMKQATRTLNKAQELVTVIIETLPPSSKGDSVSLLTTKGLASLLASCHFLANRVPKDLFFLSAKMCSAIETAKM